MTKKTLLITLSLFFLTVILRLPNLNRPLSKHHEFNTAFFLIPMEIWYETSGSNYNFSPVLNYQNKGDKGINNFTGEDTERNGDFYYLSFGAGSYVIPYFFLSFFGGPSILGLQIFSLFVHLLCALVLIKIAHWFLEENKLNTSYSVISGVVYLFLPATLWFHGNGYTHHSLVVLFFLLSVFYALKLSKNESDKRNVVFLFIFLFLTIYTEWIGCFLAFFILIFALLKRNENYRLVIFICILSVLFGVGLITFQFSQAVGFDKFIFYLRERFFVRSNLNVNSISYVSFILKWGFWYLVGYGSLIFLILFLVLKMTFTKSWVKIDKRIWLLGLPILLHHLIFSDFLFSHDYSVLIDSTFFSLLLVLLFSNSQFSKDNFKKNVVLFLLFLASSVVTYYFINRPGMYSQRGEKYSSFKEIGEFINKNTQKEEVVFIENLPDLPNPQVVYYAKRNFYSVKNTKEMEKIIKNKKVKNAFFIKIIDYKVKYSKHIGCF